MPREFLEGSGKFVPCSILLLRLLSLEETKKSRDDFLIYDIDDDFAFCPFVGVRGEEIKVVLVVQVFDDNCTFIQDFAVVNDALQLRTATRIVYTGTNPFGLIARYEGYDLINTVIRSGAYTSFLYGLISLYW